MFDVIYTTGITGFLGRNILPLLLTRFKYVVNFSRDDIVHVFSEKDKILIHVDDINFNKSYRGFFFYI